MELPEILLGEGVGLVRLHAQLAQQLTRNLETIRDFEERGRLNHLHFGVVVRFRHHFSLHHEEGEGLEVSAFRVFLPQESAPERLFLRREWLSVLFDLAVEVFASNQVLVLGLAEEHYKLVDLFGLVA